MSGEIAGRPPDEGHIRVLRRAPWRGEAPASRNYPLGMMTDHHAWSEHASEASSTGRAMGSVPREGELSGWRTRRRTASRSVAPFRLGARRWLKDTPDAKRRALIERSPELDLEAAAVHQLRDPSNIEKRLDQIDLAVSHVLERRKP